MEELESSFCENPSVRISAADQSLIVQRIIREASAELVLRVAVFGSRSRSSAVGGDIDLLVEVADLKTPKARLASKIRVALNEALGAQKIDVFIWCRNSPENSIREETFYRSIHKDLRDLWVKKNN